MRRVIQFLLLLIIAGGLFGGIAAVVAWQQLQTYMAMPGPLQEARNVVVPSGSGMAAITDLLESEGVIEKPLWFRIGARLNEQDRSLKAGEYALEPGMSPNAVLALLESGKVVQRKVTVVEGTTVHEILEILRATEGLSGELPDAMPDEGSLLPDTYFFQKGTTRAQMLERMQLAMIQTMDELWPTRAEDLPIATREEALILASIVEKETGVAEERPQVASVFVNRLRRGMRLQSDPTVIYGLTEGKGPLGRQLLRSDWEHESPYNTYVIAGLPPGPIANPGHAAIEAVLQPDETPYLYFVADGSGGHAFARTLDEHNRNVAHWRRVRDQQASD